MRIKVLFGILGCIFILCPIFVVVALADIYEYVDENGTRHFTNIPTGSHYKLIIKDRRFKGAQKFDRIISKVSRIYQVDSHLVRAVVKAESDFNPKALSRRGAVGLMQLMPRTAIDLDISDPLDPHQNLVGGVRYLSQLLTRFEGNIPLALAAYNAGPEQVARHNGIPPFPETWNFVNRVLAYYERYKGGT